MLQKELAEAERKLKELVALAGAGATASSTPRSASKKGPALELATPDPFRASMLAHELSEWLGNGLGSIREASEQLAQSSREEAFRAETDFWAAIEREARQVGLACHASPSEGEVIVETFASVTVDFSKPSARVNQRSLPTAHLPVIWSAVLEEVEKIRSKALAPEAFIPKLSEAIQNAAAKAGHKSHEPVAIHDVYREMLLLRQPPASLTTGELVPYPRALFLHELSQLADVRPGVRDTEGATISFEPSTLPKGSVRLYSKHFNEFRRVGHLQRHPARVLVPAGEFHAPDHDPLQAPPAQQRALP